MKAAVVTDFSQPLEIVEREVPEPTEGQVLVRIETCGLCHTDIHAAHGDWPVKPTPPFVPGHEGVGIVEQLGAGVTSRAVGDRVAIAWLGLRLRRLPLLHRRLGDAVRVAAEHAATRSTARSPSTPSADAAFVVPVPDGVSLRRRRAADLRRRHDVQGDQGRPRRSRPRGSPSSASAGSATWRCSTRGSSAAVVDRRRRRGRQARRWPASSAPTTSSTPRTSDPVAAIQELGGADVAVALAASPQSFEQAFASLRRGGRLVCVALPAETADR